MTQSESGFATLQNVVAAAFAMVFFAILANLVVMQYTLGVVTAALDEGARQGARSIDAVGSCETRVRATLDSVAGGSLGPGVAVVCDVDGPWLVSQVSGSLVGWAPLVPQIPFSRDARAPLEDLES